MPFVQALIEHVNSSSNLSAAEKKSFIKTAPTLNPTELSAVAFEFLGLKDVYKEYPVDIKTFIYGDYYLGKIYGPALFPIWFNLLEEIYPAPLITKYDEVILSCATRAGKSIVSALSVLYEIYKLMCMKDPASYLLGIASSKLVIGLLSYSEDQVRKSLAGYVIKGLELSPFFIDNKTRDLAESNLTKGGMEITDSIVLSAGSDVNRITGGNLYCSVLDEANIYPKNVAEGELVEKRIALYTEMLDRRASTLSKAPVMNGITWLISSPTEENDVINERICQVNESSIPRVKIKDNVSRWEARDEMPTDPDDYFDYFLGTDTKDPRILEDEDDYLFTGFEKDSTEYEEALEEEIVIKIPLRNAKGDVDYKVEFRKDPMNAIRNIAGRRSSPELAFFNTVSIFDSVFTKEQDIFTKDILTINFMEGKKFTFEDYLLNKDYFKNPTKRDCYRYIHLDIASKTDMFGLASVYSDFVRFRSEDGIEIKKRMFYVDFCLGVVASKGCKVDLVKVLKFVYDLKKNGYPIRKVTTDSHQGELARQIIRAHGVDTEYLSLEKTKEPYLNLKNAIQEGVLIGYKNPPLVKDLKGLREFNKRITKAKGRGTSDDLSNALAGAYHTCLLDKNFRSSNETLKSLIEYQNNEALGGTGGLNLNLNTGLVYPHNIPKQFFNNVSSKVTKLGRGF